MSGATLERPSRVRAAIFALVILVASPLCAQDWVAGVEATSGATYTYLTHYSRAGDFTIWQTISLLTYRTRDGAVETRVNSPGVSSGILRRWTTGQTSLGLGAGYEVRWTERSGDRTAPRSETEQGIVLEGDLTQRLAARTSARVAGRWSAANDWRTAVAEMRQEITRRLRVGPQVIWQGNEDITVVSAGGFVEIPIGRRTAGTALQIRGGQARIEHRDGAKETQPYFSAGIVIPF